MAGTKPSTIAEAGAISAENSEGDDLSDAVSLDEFPLRVPDTVNVPELKSIISKQTMLFVSPETFVANVAHVSEVMARIEARVSASERELADAKVREATMNLRLRAQEKAFKDVMDNIVTPFITHTQEELGVMHTKIASLASRLDEKIETHSSLLDERKKGETYLSAQVVELEIREGASEVKIGELKKGEGVLNDIIAQLGAETKSSLEKLSEEIGVGQRGLVEIENFGQVEAARLNKNVAELSSNSKTVAKLTSSLAVLHDETNGITAAIEALERKTTENLRETQTLVVERVKKIENSAASEVRGELEAMHNLQSDVSRLFRLAEDHHRHDGYDDPLNVHSRVLKALSKKINAHEFLLTSLHARTFSPALASSRSPSKGRGAGGMPQSSAPASLEDEYEDDFDDDQPTEKSAKVKTDFSTRLVSDNVTRASSPASKGATGSSVSALWKPGSPLSRASRVAPQRGDAKGRSAPPVQDRVWRE